MTLNDKMTIQIALDELEITELTKLDNEYIKKQYHRLALKWHPDKNTDKNATYKFQKINEAYDYLSNELKFLDIKDGINSNTSNPFVSSSSSKESTMYSNILSTFISLLLKGTYNELIINIVKEIVINKLSAAYIPKLFEDVDKQKAMELYQLLYKYRDILYLNNTILEVVSSIVEEKYKNDRVFILQPTMNDLMEYNVYKLYVDDKLYLVPLWHNELYFDAPDGSEIIVLCQPKLPNGLTIDENNHIYCERCIKIDGELRELLEGYNFVSIDIGEKCFLIPLNKLQIKKEQIYILKSQGIPQISEKDMYNVSCKADIIVKIMLV
jgi:hypothetical protein